MKKILTLLSVFCFGLLSAQTVILQEGFENTTFPPTGWNSYSLANSGAAWERSSNYSGNGIYSARHGYGSFSSDDWLVMPQKTISKPTILSFLEYNYYMSDYVYSGIYISTGSGDPNSGDFVELKEFSEDVSSFTKRSVSLVPYVGQSVYIAFRYTGDLAHIWYIDDVTLTEYPLFEDLSLNSVVQDEFTSGNISNVDLVVDNKGTDTIVSGAQVDMYVDNVFKSTVSTGKDLHPFDSDTLAFPWTSGYGKYDLMFVKKVSDDSTFNDTLTMTLLVNSNGSFVEDFENQSNTLNLGYLATGETYFSSYHYEGNSSLTLSAKTATSDTLFLNKYSIDANSMLAFYYRTGIFGIDMEVIYSTDGENWTSLSSSSPLTTTFVPAYYDLSSLQGQNIYLAIVYTNTSADLSAYLYLDKLMLPKQMEQAPDGDLFKVLDTNPQVVNNAPINWIESKLSAATVDNVKIYFGTDGGGITTPTNLLNGPIYNERIFFWDIDFDTVYYLQIVPENAHGAATNAPIWSIHAPSRPYYTPDYTETFTNENMPLDWIEGEGTLTDSSTISMWGSDWNTSDFLNNGSSNALRINLYNSYQKEWVFSPNVILGDQSHDYKLDFDLGITAGWSSSVDTLMDDDSVAVVMSNTQKWGKDNVLLWLTDKDSIGLEKHISLDIPAEYYNDTSRIAFYAKSTVYNNDIEIFIDNFTVHKVPEDASLSNILTDGNSITNFNPTVKNYQLKLASGATVPIIEGIATDTNAVVTYKHATSLDDVDSIIVTAQNPNYTDVYTVSFVVESTDATLKDLLVNDVTVDGFSSEQTTYNVELPAGSAIPVVSAVANDINATVDITQPSVLPGTATVNVTAEYPDSSQTYTINFTVKTSSLTGLTAESVSIYPNPASDYVVIDVKGANQITLTSIDGKVVYQSVSKVTGKTRINLNSLAKGTYLIEIRQDGQKVRRVLLIK